jgi:hypothetical protein
MSIYEFDGTTLTRLADPASLPTSDGNGANWSSDGQFLAIADFSSPYIGIYQTTSTMPDSGIVTIRGIKRAGT